MSVYGFDETKNKEAVLPMKNIRTLTKTTRSLANGNTDNLDFVVLPSAGEVFTGQNVASLCVMFKDVNYPYWSYASNGEGDALRIVQTVVSYSQTTGFDIQMKVKRNYSSSSNIKYQVKVVVGCFE